MSCSTPDYTHTNGETDENLEVTLQAGGVTTDLTGSTVVLEMVNRKTRAAVEFAMTPVDITQGTFVRDWADGEPDRGRYNARYRITLLGGAVRYSPTGAFMLYEFV